MILNDEQKARFSEFFKFITIDDVVNAMCETPCDECPLHEKCPMEEEMKDTEFITKNSCEDVMYQYILDGTIVDRRNEEDENV